MFKYAIDYVGAYGLPRMYRDGAAQSVNDGKFLDKTLRADTNALARRPPINRLDQLKTRAMLVVGRKHERAPPVHGKNLHAALLKRHIEHTWLYKPDEMHEFYGESSNTELYARLVQFLDSDIGAVGTGADAASPHRAAETPHATGMGR